MKSQELLVKLSEKRTAFYEENMKPEPNKEALHVVVKELRDLEANYQDAVKAEAEKPEVRELAVMRNKVRVSEYVKAAAEMRSVDGANLEFNQHLSMTGRDFPMELLAPPEERATTDSETAKIPRRWIDRLLASTAAARVGVTMESVPAGVASYPVTTAGGSSGQRKRSEASSAVNWTIGVTEAKPKRNAMHLVFSVEDSYRIPGLEEALVRDMRMGMMEQIDKMVFLGDATASDTEADIAGLTTATSVVEKSLTQAKKVKGPDTLQALTELVDGIHATTAADLRIVASVGTNVLWNSNLVASTADSTTLAKFLRDAGIMWSIRGGIDTATSAGDWGAFIGRATGIEGAACLCLWQNASLIVDPYTQSSKGEVNLTLNSMVDFVLPRPTSFVRLKYVA